MERLMVGTLKRELQLTPQGDLHGPAAVGELQFILTGEPADGGQG
jgi:hypothetical protein